VLCTAYRLRHKGHKLDPDAIRRSGCVGELTYRQRLIAKTPEWHVMTAALVIPGSETYVFPVLDRARLLKIRGNGLLITGVEIIPLSRGIKNIKADYFQQTWWCVPYVYAQGDEPESAKGPTKLGWREQSGVEHARRCGLPEPDFTPKDRT
jgi:hypothetical protein